MAPMRGLHLTRPDDGPWLIELDGEQDLATSVPLRDALIEAAEARRPVVLELSVVSFIDSTILGVILGGLRRAKELELGYALVIADEPSAAVPRLLEITGLRAIFPIFLSRADALASAGAGHNEPALPDPAA